MPTVPAERWPAERIDALAKQLTDHIHAMTALAIKVGGHGENITAQQRELGELERATERAGEQMRELLSVVDRSCAEKVNELSRDMRVEFVKTRKEVKEEVRIQVALQMAQMAKDRTLARAAPYAAVITGTAAIIASVVTRGG